MTTIPEWINIDKLVTPEQIEEIAAVRDALLALMPGALTLSGRIAAVHETLDDHSDVPDDTAELVRNIVGCDEVGDLASMLGVLLGLPDCIPTDEYLLKLRDRWVETFPDLAVIGERWQERFDKSARWEQERRDRQQEHNEH